MTFLSALFCVWYVSRALQSWRKLRFYRWPWTISKFYIKKVSLLWSRDLVIVWSCHCATMSLCYMPSCDLCPVWSCPRLTLCICLLLQELPVYSTSASFFCTFLHTQVVTAKTTISSYVFSSFLSFRHRCQCQLHRYYQLYHHSHFRHHYHLFYLFLHIQQYHHYSHR